MRRLAAGIVVMCLAGVCLAAPRAGGLWLDIPYVRQPRNGCGAACLAMVIEYWRRHDARFQPPAPDVDAIQKALYSPKARGITAKDMAAYLGREGLRAFAFRGDWDLLQHHVSQGRPLIVCLREGNELHYVVVAGMDAADAVILVNDPARQPHFPLSRAAFEKEWSREDNWTLLALPQPRE